jgi:hypothetical protein
MSDLMNARTDRNGFRVQLLSTASAAAILASVMAVDAAKAADDERPTVWIELGGQLERQSGLGDPFEAPFMLVTPTPKPYEKGSPIAAQRAPNYSLGGEGKLTLEPQGSDWVFSAQIRYGRSQKHGQLHQQTNYGKTSYHSATPSLHGSEPFSTVYQPAAQFADTIVKQSQSHAIIDFMAGKDVGLGIFGHDGSSVFSAGVRYAQFSSRSSALIKAVPHVELYNRVPTRFLHYYPNLFIPGSHYLLYSAFASATRSFRGVGPSLSWNASVPIIGNERVGGMSFDWGLNGAVLFGRQKATTSHHSTTHFKTQKYPPTPTVVHQPRRNVRSRSVLVPDVGLSASVSYRIESFKMTLGYRGDFFFGAVDAGWDARKTTDLTFHGPFLNFGVGL